jgi:integrase
MPRKSVPSYRMHRQSGQAIVTLSDRKTGQRRDYLLGPYHSPASRVEYARLLMEQQSIDGRLPVKTGDAKPSDLTLNELMLAYVRYAASYYVKDSEPTTEQEAIRQALRFLKSYGHSIARNFGPLGLRAVRNSMIAHKVTCKTKVKDANGNVQEVEKVLREGLSRGTINRQIARIKLMFKWAVGQELVPAETYQRLACVEGLRRGKAGARERPRVRPVADEVVNATLPHLPSVVADMVRLQRLTGARPGEIVQLRATDIDRSGGVWEFRPERHKTEHHDRERVIFFGPQAQLIINRYLGLDLCGPLFRPDQSEAARNAERRKERKTPMWPSHLQMQEQKKMRRSRRLLHEAYDVSTYRRAITRACAKAGVPTWTPHRLRHAAATEIRRQFGLEAAQAVLGHAALGVTQVYAEKDMEAARRIMAKIG